MKILQNKKFEGFSIQRFQQLGQQYSKIMEFYNIDEQKTDELVIEKSQMYRLNFDGASFNNPGQSGVGIAISKENEVLKQIAIPVGIKTNNQVEFLALIYGLRYASFLGIDFLLCQGDSKLVIESMKDKMQIHNEALKELQLVAKFYALFIKNITFEHVPRTQNQLADKLSKSGAQMSVKLAYEMKL